jgi:Spy/CpxP family protein refolding chaperone
MKAKILIMVVLMGFSSIMIAQPVKNDSEKSFHGQEWRSHGKNGQNGPMSRLNLTDAQKDTFKQSMMALQKEVKPLRNELGEAMAHQKTLVSADKPDMSAIDKNIEKIGNLKVEMAKIQVKHRLDLRAQLTDEQRLKFDMFKGRMNHGKRANGMNCPMGMQQDSEMN